MGAVPLTAPRAAAGGETIDVGARHPVAVRGRARAT